MGAGNAVGGGAEEGRGRRRGMFQPREGNFLMPDKVLEANVLCLEER